MQRSNYRQQKYKAKQRQTRKCVMLQWPAWQDRPNMCSVLWRYICTWSSIRISGCWTYLDIRDTQTTTRAAMTSSRFSHSLDHFMTGEKPAHSRRGRELMAQSASDWLGILWNEAWRCWSLLAVSSIVPQPVVSSNQQVSINMNINCCLHMGDKYSYLIYVFILFDILRNMVKSSLNPKDWNCPLLCGGMKAFLVI